MKPYAIAPDGSYALISGRKIDRDTLCNITADFLMRDMVREKTALTDPRSANQFLKAKLQHIPHEVFCVLFLDNRHRVISFKEMFRGTIDGASVHPREVVREAINCNAAAVILAHNHPSGVAEPSAADVAITRRLRDALALIDVRILDHLIVGGDSCNPISLAERGLV